MGRAYLKGCRLFKEFGGKFLLALSMRADVKVYVTASEDELAKKRGEEVNHELLRRQLKLYDKVATLIRAYRIDTTGKVLKRR